MEDQKTRIAKLSERFKPHAGGENARSKPTARKRERRSFYLRADVMDRLDRDYKEYNHRAYPRTVSKSVFMEAVLEYGLDNLLSIQELIEERSETEAPEA